jgi:hypothetical protein
MRRAVAPTSLMMVLALAGCSGNREGKPAADGGSGSAAAAVPGIDPASRLDLDSGRVSVFSPQGWRRAPRSYDYLVRYQSTPQLPYPSVVVVAADPPAGITEVTADNHAAFGEAVAAALEETAGKAVLRKPAKAKAGPHHAATWSVAGEAKLDGVPKKIERECTAVVVDGRLYTVEAWAPRGKLSDVGREAARAVAAAVAVPSLEPIESLVPAEPEATTEPVTPAEPAEPAASAEQPAVSETPAPGSLEPATEAAAE